MITNLNQEQLSSVKRSYLNIVALFLSEEKIESRFLRCILKWGFQLHLTPKDLDLEQIDVSHLAYTEVTDKVEKLESIYHLVYVIYLDNIVEDVELEVASIYAEKLGFNSEIVSELFKSIATEPYDDTEPRNVKQEIIDFLKLNNT